MNAAEAKAPYLKTALALCLAVALGVASLLTLRAVGASLPQALEYRRGETDTGIDYTQIAIGREMLGDQLAINAESTSTAHICIPSGRICEDPVSLVQTDASYLLVRPLILRKGAFFQDENKLTDRRVCVISTSLATELFLSLDAVGQKVLINDETYTVVGVYIQRDSLLDRISTDGREQVFIPLPTASDPQAQPNVLFVAGIASTTQNASQTGSSVSTVMREALYAAFDHKLDNYECTDYFEIHRLLDQEARFFWFGAGLVAFVYVARLLVRSVRSMYSWLQCTYRSEDPVRFGPFAQRLTLPLACAAVMAAIVCLCCFQLYWPPEFVPKGKHLLNLAFYWNLVIESFQKFNVSAHTRYQCLQFYGGWLAAGLGAAGIAAWWRTLANAWKIFTRKTNT